MPGYDENVYYYPEKSGLSSLGEIEYSDAFYQFDTRVVWLHAATGRLLTARDSGCSCPTPFKDFTLETLEDITHRFAAFLADEYKEELKGYSCHANREDVDALVRKCAAAMTPKGAF